VGAKPHLPLQFTFPSEWRFESAIDCVEVDMTDLDIAHCAFAEDVQLRGYYISGKLASNRVEYCATT